MNVTGNQENSRKHCRRSGCPQRDSAEHEEYAGALTGSGIAENNITNAGRPKGGLLEEIITPSNLNQAYKRVKSNKGAGGVDRMRVQDLLQYLIRQRARNQADHQGRKNTVHNPYWG